MRKYPDVTAHADLYAGGEGLAETHPLLADAFRFGVDTFPPPIVLRYGISRCERGAEGDSFGFHQGKQLGSPAVAVLDGCNPRFDRSAHPFGGGRVDGNDPAAAGGDFDSLLQLFDGECRLSFAVGAPAVIGI